MAAELQRFRKEYVQPVQLRYDPTQRRSHIGRVLAAVKDATSERFAEKKTMFCRSFCMLGKRGRLRGRSQHLAGVVANLGKVLVPLCDVIEGIRSLKKCDQVSRSSQEVKEGLFTCSGR